MQTRGGRSEVVVFFSQHIVHTTHSKLTRISLLLIVSHFHATRRRRVLYTIVWMLMVFPRCASLGLLYPGTEMNVRDFN